MAWTLDPVDGTVNFVHGIPLCGVALALIDHDQPVLGVIDLPFLGARYWATQGQGAFLNDHRLQLAGAQRLCDAIVALGDFEVGPQAGQENPLRFEVTNQIASQALRVRMLGSAAIDLAWLAEGKLDASITLCNRPWDMAAASCLPERQAHESWTWTVPNIGWGPAPCLLALRPSPISSFRLSAEPGGASGPASRRRNRPTRALPLYLLHSGPSLKSSVHPSRHAP